MDSFSAPTDVDPVGVPLAQPIVGKVTITCRHKFKSEVTTRHHHDGWNLQERKYLVIFCENCGHIAGNGYV